MTEYSEQGESAILLANREGATPYAEQGEGALLLANRDDALVPSRLAKYELRTVIEGFRDPTQRIRSSRDVWNFLKDSTLAADCDIVVLPVDAKNHPVNIVELKTRWDRQPAAPAKVSVETCQNILAIALLSGAVSFVLGLKRDVPELEEGDPYAKLVAEGRRAGCTLLDIILFSPRDQLYRSMLDAGRLQG